MTTRPTSTLPLRAAAVTLVLGAVAFGPAALSSPATAEPTRSPAMTMPMGNAMPEYVATAYAALRHRHTKAATADLQKAVATKAEPKAARAHAREALAALEHHDGPMAEMHAAKGAAVEHLTYARQALQAGHAEMARGHLVEALALPKVRKYAKAAIAAIKGGHRAGARRQIEAGLNAANHD